MKRVFFTIILLVSIASQVGLLSAGAFLTFFQARSDGDDVVLEWQTGNETNLKQFVIERKSTESSYIEIAEVQPKGSNSFYEYNDQSAYKITDAVYIYRLKIEDNDGAVSYSQEISIAHKVSSVKRTWGSIKALFR